MEVEERLAEVVDGGGGIAGGGGCSRGHVRARAAEGAQARAQAAAGRFRVGELSSCVVSIFFHFQ